MTAFSVEDLKRQIETAEIVGRLCNQVRAFKETLPAIVFALRYDDLGDEDCMTWVRSLARWEGSWKLSLSLPHSGDCTDECHSCIRCQAEDCIRVARMIEEGLKDGN